MEPNPKKTVHLKTEVLKEAKIESARQDRYMKEYIESAILEQVKRDQAKIVTSKEPQVQVPESPVV